MLEVQRQRSFAWHSEVNFTRRVLVSHLVIGAMVVLLLVLHRVLNWAAGAGLWFLLSMLPLWGMLTAHDCCRHVLAGFFMLFSGAGVYFLAQVAPGLPVEEDPLLPRAFLPIWVGMLNLLYTVGAACVLTHSKVRKAVSLGFTLW